MHLDHWFRCTVCGYMYTPPQVQALVQFFHSHSGPEPKPPVAPESILCRVKGCTGTLAPTDEPYRPPHR
jgi:hypothetical protein